MSVRGACIWQGFQCFCLGFFYPWLALNSFFFFCYKLLYGYIILKYCDSDYFKKISVMKNKNKNYSIFKLTSV